MTSRWELSDLEFVALWEPFRAGTVPRPFQFTSRIPDYDDYQREKEAIRDRMRNTLGQELGGALEAAACPDIRVVVAGYDGADPKDPKAQVRLLAVRRGGLGYVLVQLPGETQWHSGGYIIAEHDALVLAMAVAEALPDKSAGRLGRLVLPRQGDDMDHSYQRSVAHELTHDPDRDRAVEFRRSQICGQGSIEISQGSSRFGPRGIVRRVLSWRDLDRDGRYAVTAANPPVAIGAGAERLAGLINAEIAEVVLAIKDERS
ncbi:ESX secretion-associated protein EspG [Nocardia sp. NPDC051832]|uniref:ESX secretion-associated protein EspG n=1 Tax=Nocardia sp. NPDC051832 TaxID=3155673 RepID=UPI0034176C4C